LLDLHTTVTVTSTATPPITWHCPTCRRAEAFVCSERFRANANGKLVDIWLIYRCGRCDRTKNITVVERRPVAKVDRALLGAAMSNDAATARRLARDVGLLKRAGASVAGGDAWTVDGVATSRTLTVAFPEPLLVRFDAVASAALGVRRRDVVDSIEPVEGRLDTLRCWSTIELRRR
jgi:hypothetical protein